MFGLSTTPSKPISAGIVSPWKTSVTRMTQYVRKMIRLRPGKGCPATLSGRASAAANETTPRIPVQPKSGGPASGGHPARPTIRGTGQRRRVFGRAQRRVDLRRRAIIFEALVGQDEVMGRHLARRLDTTRTGPANQIDARPRREMRDVPALPGLSGDQQVARDDDVLGQARRRR